MKKYTKTQLKKDQIAAVIDTLEHEFDAYNIERENQYIEFFADYKSHRFQFQMDTRDYSVATWDSMILGGGGWSQEEIDKQKFAVELEDRVNREIRLLMASESMFAHEESFINYMNR